MSLRKCIETLSAINEVLDELTADLAVLFLKITFMIACIWASLWLLEHLP